MTSSYSTVTVERGVTLAYELRGSRYIHQAVPLVLVNGMASLRQDWDKLTNSLSSRRPVLIYDHRGMGDSVCSDDAVKDISIETLARDLLALITHLRLKYAAFCGWSMGGVVVQQLLTLPFHPTRPTPLPFYPSHVILVATRSRVLINHGLDYKPAAGGTRTPAEKRMIAIKLLEQTFDPNWLESHRPRFEFLCKRGATGSRPPLVVAKQQEALRTFNFVDLLPLLPRNLKTLIIHGELDQVIPFQAGQAMLDLFPSAQLLDAGQAQGKLPSLRFGHYWYEYFEVDVWREVLDVFMSK